MSKRQNRVRAADSTTKSPLPTSSSSDLLLAAAAVVQQFDVGGPNFDAEHLQSASLLNLAAFASLSPTPMTNEKSGRSYALAEIANSDPPPNSAKMALRKFLKSGRKRSSECVKTAKPCAAVTNSKAERIATTFKPNGLAASVQRKRIAGTPWLVRSKQLVTVKFVRNLSFTFKNTIKSPLLSHNFLPSMDAATVDLLHFCNNMSKIAGGNDDCIKSEHNEATKAKALCPAVSGGGVYTNIPQATVPHVQRLSPAIITSGAVAGDDHCFMAQQRESPDVVVVFGQRAEHFLQCSDFDAHMEGRPDDVAVVRKRGGRRTGAVIRSYSDPYNPLVKFSRSWQSDY